MKLPYTLLIAILLFGSSSSFAILHPQVDSIPMRDGKKLAADVYIPAGMVSGPVILIQTPYNRQLYRIGGLPLDIGTKVDSSKYIIVIVDWRGFYGSKLAAYVNDPALGQDGYDCVEWIAQQSWSNGKVGTWGPSALGRAQLETAEKNPPHLTCICPLVAGPQYSYNEYFPNGDLRTEYVEQLDLLGFGLSPVLMAHPYYDFAWSVSEAQTFYPDSIRVPCYMIGGWYDHTIEQMLPFFSAIQTQSPVQVRNLHRLLMGPWVHGGHGIANVGSATQGQLTYANAVHWDDSLALLFFDYHLRNISNNWELSPAVQYYQMGDNTWLNSPSWPPAGPSSANLYLHTGGVLDAALPVSSGDSVSFTYEPNDPSPTVGGPTLRSDLDQGPYDQAPSVESRSDIAIFTTAVLTQDMVMKGNATVHLKVSSNRKDTDFDIRLTDVYPDNRSMLVNDGVMRMRFRNGETTGDTASMVAGNVYDCTIKLPNTSITFLAGHKIRVDVTSSNYPRFNRNMNTGGAMYPGNSIDSLVNPLVATNTVYTNSSNASYISLPLETTTGIHDANAFEGSVTLFPNPVSGVLNIAINNDQAYEVKIFDPVGQQLTELKMLRKASIDLSAFPQGIYLVQLSDSIGAAICRKVVK